MTAVGRGVRVNVGPLEDGQDVNNRRVFISYSSEDLGEAELLARRLRERGYEPVYDIEGLRGRAGDSWQRWVADAIDGAGRMVSVWTAAAVANYRQASTGGAQRHFRVEWDLGSHLARSSRRRGFLVPLALVPHSALPGEVRSEVHFANGRDRAAFEALFPLVPLDAARRARSVQISLPVLATVVGLTAGALAVFTWGPAEWRSVVSGGALALAVAVLGWALWPRSRLVAQVGEVRDRLQSELFRIPRDDDCKAVLTNCQQHGLVHLVGWSGCGKTDLIAHQIEPRLPRTWVPLVVRDWGDGAEETLRRRLCDVLDRAWRRAGIGPLSPLEWTDVAGRLDQLVREGRVPFIVLDQFDEYEVSAHRAAWARAPGAFWPMLAERVADGRVRCLIASRRTVASPIGELAGLRPRTVPLGGMSAASVDDRVQVFMAQLMVHPTRGWPALWARVRETIGRTDSIVPADLHLVMSGLVSLDSLTSRALDRRGGLPALTRDSIAQRLAKAVRKAGLDNDVVAAVLGRMVGPADVATPASLDELRAAVLEVTGRAVEPTRLRALSTALFEERLVRLVLGVDGSSRWTLDHDTLAGPLRAHIAVSWRLRHQWVRAMRSAAAGRGWSARLPLSILARLAWDRLRRGRDEGAGGGRWVAGVIIAASLVPVTLGLTLAAGVALAVGAGWQYQRAIKVAEVGDWMLAEIDEAAQRTVGSERDEAALRPLLAELSALSPTEAGRVLTRLLDRRHWERLDAQRRMAKALIGEAPERRRAILTADGDRLLEARSSPLHAHVMALMGEEPRAVAWLAIESSRYGKIGNWRRVEQALDGYDAEALMTWLGALVSCRSGDYVRAVHMRRHHVQAGSGLPDSIRRLLAERAGDDPSLSARVNAIVAEAVESDANSPFAPLCADIVLDAVSTLGGSLPGEAWSSWWGAWWSYRPPLHLTLLPPSTTPGEALERSLVEMRVLEWEGGRPSYATLEASFAALYDQMTLNEIRMAWAAWAASPRLEGWRHRRDLFLGDVDIGDLRLCSGLGSALGALPVGARPLVAEVLLEALSEPRSTAQIAPLTAAVAQFPEVTSALPIERWFTPLLDAGGAASRCLATSAVEYGRAVADTQIEAALDGLVSMPEAHTASTTPSLSIMARAPDEIALLSDAHTAPLPLVLITRLAARSPSEAAQRLEALMRSAPPLKDWLPVLKDAAWTASEGAALGALLAHRIEAALPDEFLGFALASCEHWTRRDRDRVGEALLSRDAGAWWSLARMGA